MLRFDAQNARELKRFLYRSALHRAKLEPITHDQAGKTFYLDAKNGETTYHFALYDVAAVLFTRGGWPGDRRTILSLTLDDPALPPKEGCLRLRFQMLSGDELHFCAKTVYIDQIG